MADAAPAPAAGSSSKKPSYKKMLALLHKEQKLTDIYFEKSNPDGTTTRIIGKVQRNGTILCNKETYVRVWVDGGLCVWSSEGSWRRRPLLIQCDSACGRMQVLFAGCICQGGSWEGTREHRGQETLRLVAFWRLDAGRRGQGVAA